MTTSIAQQEKEFQRAVQPGSPISALLSSARQPLMMGTTTTRESPLLRRLQAAAKESPVRTRVGKGLHGIQEEELGPGGKDHSEEEVRNKELESQKARIVAQMVPARDEDNYTERENVPPVRKEVKGKERARNVPLEEPARREYFVCQQNECMLNGFLQPFLLRS
jgi:hypothetical protein